MRTIYPFILAAFILSSFSACNIINPAEVVPTYVQIDSFTFNARQLGTVSHKITNVWVYFDNAPIGNFDLPARFPVIAAQAGTLTVIPGIDYDGLSGFPNIYPLYKSDTLHLVPAPAAVIPFKPVTGYSDNAMLQFEEAFDEGAGKQNTFADTAILNTTDPSKVFQGSGSGMMHLSTADDSTIVLSAVIKPITAGRDAYIEFDYRGTLTLRVGMSATLNSTGEEVRENLIGLNARTAWGKVYVDIKTFIASHQNSEYRLFLRVDKPENVSEGEMLIDNLKVVSF